MCGIVGIINGNKSVKWKQSNVFEEMLWVDQIRGEDGAGVMWLNDETKKAGMFKNADYGEIFSNKEVKKALKDIEKVPFMVGHNRSATKGATKSENNHPFKEKHVMLVHNGTMGYVPSEHEKGTEVDSHAICKMIAAEGIEKFMSDAHGPYALVWIDTNTGELNLIRNIERPLCLIRTQDFYIITSEWWVGAGIAARNDFTVDSNKSFVLKPKHLYTFKPYNLDYVVKDLSDVVFSRRWVRQQQAHPFERWDVNDEFGDECGELIQRVEERVHYPASSRYPAIENAQAHINGLGQKEFESRWAVLPHLQYFRSFNKDYSCMEMKTIDDDILDAVIVEQSDSPMKPRHILSSDGKNKLLKVILDPNNEKKLEMGKRINFSFDDLNPKKDKQKKRANQNKIVGNIPGFPVSKFVVYGQTGLSEDEIIATNNFFSGEISDLIYRDNKYVIWVKQIAITHELDPQWADRKTEETKTEKQ